MALVSSKIDASVLLVDLLDLEPWTALNTCGAEAPDSCSRRFNSLSNRRHAVPLHP